MTTKPQDRIDSRTIASLIGLLLLMMPNAMLVAYLFGECFRDSISQFYYGRYSGDLLVVLLFSAGVLLCLWPGTRPGEGHISSIAAIGAFAVALIPAVDSGLEPDGDCAGRAFVKSSIDLTSPYFESFDGAGALHIVGAVAFLSCLAFLTLRLFTQPPHESATEERTLMGKALRDVTYYSTTAIALGSLLILLVYVLFGKDWDFWRGYNLTFWFEAFAMWAMGVAWLVKGRLFGRFLIEPA